MERKKYLLKQNIGITLIALVVTIVVLIILATISINGVLGENGIIRKASEAEEIYNNSVVEEQEAMNKLLEEYENAIAEPPIYDDNTLVIAPKLTAGMTKVKWNSSIEKWEKVTDDSTQWYNYANKEWANVVLVGTNGKDATGEVDVFNSDGTLNENSAYTQLVWIPRYAYKITSLYHSEGTGAGNIEIVFIDTANKGRDGTEYSTEYPEATIEGMEDYVVHPAFDYGGTHLSGFWVGKFESSNTNCTTDVTTGQVTYTGNEIMTIKANVTSWRQISIENSFNACLNMNRSGNPYGLSTSDNIVDPHMTKNDEWGAVAYLSQSMYGKNAEVWNNSNTSFITGMAGSSVNAANEENTNKYNTELGVEASTTGNVTGIYDMSGGSWERVAAYVNNGHENLEIYGKSLTMDETPNRYRNVYASTVSDGSEAKEDDYALATPSNGYYGDAIYEISESYSGSSCWYGDYSNFPYTDSPFLFRGGDCFVENIAGVFAFSPAGGAPWYGHGIRATVVVL